MKPKIVLQIWRIASDFYGACLFAVALFHLGLRKIGNLIRVPNPNTTVKASNGWKTQDRAGDEVAGQ